MNALGLPPRTMPNLNTYRILNLIWKRRAISRIEIAAELGLTKSTVTKITAQWLDEGLLTEGGGGRVEGRGRPRTALTLNPDRGGVLGLEVRTDGWAAVLVRIDGSVARSARGRRAWNPATLAEDLADLIASQTADRPESLAILGVGLAVPGIVDVRTGTLLRSNPLGLQDPLDLGTRLEALTGLPLTVENDAKAGCWGELAFGGARDHGPFLFVLCEDRPHRLDPEAPSRVAAVGFGLVLGARPWRGPDHSAGEFSSVLKANPEGRSFQFSLPDEVLRKTFADPEAEAALVEELGRNVAMLVNFLNLRRVYLAWPATGDASRAQAALGRLIAGNWLYPTAVDCQVSPPSGGADAIAWGAAGAFLEAVLGEATAHDDQPRWK